MLTSREQLLKALEDKEYRHGFVREFLRTGLAYQIRATRRARDLTQAELGALIDGGMAQEYVSKLENPDTMINVATAERVAKAFDCALVMRLVPFSRLLDWATDLAETDLNVPSFDMDYALAPAHPLSEVLAKLPAAIGFSMKSSDIDPILTVDAGKFVPRGDTGMRGGQLEAVGVRGVA